MGVGVIKKRKIFRLIALPQVEISLEIRSMCLTIKRVRLQNSLPGMCFPWWKKATMCFKTEFDCL